jgi:hypothetical protein
MKEKYLPIIIAGVTAYLTPIFTALIFIGFLVMADWFTGVIKGYKDNKFSSRLAIRKFYVGASYLIVLFVVRMAEVYFGDDIPMVKPLVAIIAISELQSLRENITAITGVDLFKHLFGVLKSKSNNDATD